MKTTTIFVLLISSFLLGSVLTLSYKDVVNIKTNFEAQYLHVAPYKTFISSVSVISEKDEYSLFVSLLTVPPKSIQFPQSFRGVKVIYKVVPSICTQEALICPDGITYVGRTGPNCEFAPCPNFDSNFRNSTLPAIRTWFNRAFTIFFILILLSVFLIVFAFICCCCALIKAAKCRRNRCNFSETNSQVLQPVVTPQHQIQQQQQQQHQFYYYQPSSQSVMFTSENAMYPGFNPLTVANPSQQQQQQEQEIKTSFQPISDEEYARQLQAKLNQQ